MIDRWRPAHTEAYQSDITLDQFDDPVLQLMRSSLTANGGGESAVMGRFQHPISGAITRSRRTTLLRFGAAVGTNDPERPGGAVTRWLRQLASCLVGGTSGAAEHGEKIGMAA